MKILYASFDVVPSPKGASVHIQAFVRALADGHEVTLLTLRNSILGPVDIPGVRHITVDAADPNFLRRTVAFGDAVEAHLDRNRYDIVHFRSIWEGVPASLAARNGGHATVYELNGLPSIELKYHYPNLSRRHHLVRQFQQHEKLCLDLADRVITPSRLTAEYITDELGAGADKLTVIPNGVDTALFCPSGDDRVDLRNLLYVGTLAPWQGIEILFRAVRKLLGRTGDEPGQPEVKGTEGDVHRIEPADVRLTVCGGGRKSWRKQVRRMARKMKIDDRVDFIGTVRQTEVPGIIRKAGICVAPLAPDDRNMRQGCCPIKLLEYAACRKPICCSNLQVATDLLEPEREFAAYRAHSAHNLAERIAELIARPGFAAAIAENAWRKVTSQFTWEIACKRLLEVYEQLERGRHA